MSTTNGMKIGILTAGGDCPGILTLGGTILGTSREKPFKEDKKQFNTIDKPKLIKKHYKEMGLETRQTILGYIQRGGSPSPMDRLLATRYGASAVEMISKGEFGVMVALNGKKIVGVPLEEVENKLRTVPPEHPMVVNSRKMDVCFGDGKRLSMG